VLDLAKFFSVAESQELMDALRQQEEPQN